MKERDKKITEGQRQIYKEVLLQQVKYFVKGVTQDSKISSRDLVQTGVLLLKTLPATRFAVLEYFSTVYDDTVRNLLTTNEDSLDSEQYVVIDDIQETLLAFVQINPNAWTPIISAWAIELLGQISSKYTDKYLRRKNLGHSASLNEVLQMWMGCRATKSLIEIASDCIASMVGDTPDSCVDALLETSVKHSPHFDWVVAHIGLCFPRTIINRVLMCGLKDFCMHGGSQAEIGMVLEENMPKFASVVGILGHLASQHGREIKTALLTLFEESLNEDTKDMYHQVVPFLLRLASMSTMLLKVITTDFVSIFTREVLNKLADQSVHWFEKGEEDNDGLLNLLVLLLTSAENGNYRLLQLLLDTAYPVAPSPDAMETEVVLKPVVQKTSQRVLELLLMDLSKVVHTKCNSGSVDIPFLKGLESHTSSVSRMLSQAQGERHGWLCKIMKCLAISSGESQAAKILCDVLVYSKTTQQLPFFISLQEELQIKLHDILENTTQDLFHIIESTHKLEKKVQTLKNILEILRWEKTERESGRVTRCTFTVLLDVHLDSLINLISHPNDEVSSTSLQILNHTDLPKCLPILTITKMCHSVVAFCFRLFKSKDLKKVEMCSSCKICVQKLCAYPTSQKTLLRLLLETALSKEGGPCLGAKSLTFREVNNDNDSSSSPGLLQMNASYVGTLGRSSHGGIIGQGLRSRSNLHLLTKDHIQFNKQLFLDIIWTVATFSNLLPKADETSMDTGNQSKEQTPLSPHISRVIALLLIEMLTPDVMYNGIPWPEDDFMKVTIERDLLIKKKLEENPILWDILDFLSSAPGAICYCSAIIRGVMATLLYHWDGNRDKSAKNSPWQYEATCKIVEYMRKGQFLPPPLSYSGELLPYITPYEVSLVLINLWRYMKENPPVPEERNWKEIGIDSKFLEALRPIFHKNIAQLGHMYGRFFET